MIRSLKDARKKKCPILFSMKRGSMGSIPHETIHNCVADDCQWWAYAEGGKGACVIHAIGELLGLLVERLTPPGY